jgi:hypothetical protein
MGEKNQIDKAACQIPQLNVAGGVQNCFEARQFERGKASLVVAKNSTHYLFWGAVVGSGTFAAV